MKKIIKTITFAVLVLSCTQQNSLNIDRLRKLDNILENQPRAVLDSLKTIDVEKLNKKSAAYYYLLEASAMDKSFKPLPSDSMLQISIEFYKNEKDFYNQARGQYYLAKQLFNKNEKEAAYDLLKQAGTNLEANTRNESHLTGLIYFQLAKIQDNQGNLSEAEIFYKKSLTTFLATKDTISAIHSLKQLGQTKINNKEYEEANTFLFEALRLVNQTHYEAPKKIAEAKATTLTSLSVLYREIDDLKKALQYSKESLLIFQQAGLKASSTYYHNVVAAFHKLGELDSAKHYCQQMITTVERNHSLFNSINSYKLLFQIEEQQGNYKEACRLKDKFNELKDNLNVNSNKTALIEVEKKYNLAEKEKQVLKAENQFLWASSIICLILFLGTVFGLYFYHRHKKLKTEVRELSEDVKRTKWGFLVSKELITDNHNTYAELERILSRYQLSIENGKMYNEFQDVFKKQKENYSTRLFATLTNVDDNFIKSIQAKCPKLTPEEIMIAAMIRHQWNTTEIAAVFHVNLDAMRKRKARLKNKILGKNEPQSLLEDYLTKL